MEDRNCPFYGRHLVVLGNSLALIDSHGNQCALITTGHAPCLLEREIKPVDWRLCPRVDAIRLTISQQH